MDNDHLLKLLRLRASHEALSEGTIARNNGGYFDLPKRLAKGEGCGLKRYVEMVNSLDLTWPEDLEWPADIPRPSKSVRHAS